MFENTWRWAGTYRTTNKNIGVAAYLVATQVRQLCDDVRAQVEFAAYSWPELAARFHRDLVWIHPFPNGNGRHARLAADLLLIYNRQPRFTWGSLAREKSGEAIRQEYLAALRDADQGNYERLMHFAQS